MQRVTSESGSGPLVGVAAYRDSANGALATVPSQSAGATRFFFGHIASLAPWYTGVALLNATTSAANIEVSAIDGNGQLIGSSAAFSISAGTRRTVLLSELVPAVAPRSSDGGFVFVRTTNNVSLFGFELFGHSLFPVLANVQGFALASNSTYTPPQGSSTGGGGTPQITMDQVTTTDGISVKTSFRPLDRIVYVATVNNSASSAVTGEVTYDVKDARAQSMLTVSFPVVLAVGSNPIPYGSFLPSNVLNGAYSFTASVKVSGITSTKSVAFNVAGGTSTPTLSQETPGSSSTADVFQVAFRPGDTARFSVIISNFTTQTTTAVLNYGLSGPGDAPAVSGGLSFSVPLGLSIRTVDISIPAGSAQGLYAFKSSLTAGGRQSSKGTTITVAPRTLSETIELDGVYAAGVDGIPAAGFMPGSSIVLNTSRLSLSATPSPVTLRYLVTGPSGKVLDQSLGVTVSTGRSLGSIPMSLSADAGGVYTFQGTLTYQDVSNVTRTSTVSTEFTVALKPPTSNPIIVARRPYVTDINGVPRTILAPGESFYLVRTVYSSFPTPVPGTVRYVVLSDAGKNLFDDVVSTTFSPGENKSFFGLTSSASIGLTNFSFTVTAASQGQTSTSTFAFSFNGSRPPNLDFLSSER